jgi:hypothetical protein
MVFRNPEALEIKRLRMLGKRNRLMERVTRCFAGPDGAQIKNRQRKLRHHHLHFTCPFLAGSGWHRQLNCCDVNARPRDSNAASEIFGVTIPTPETGLITAVIVATQSSGTRRRLGLLRHTSGAGSWFARAKAVFSLRVRGKQCGPQACQLRYQPAIFDLGGLRT